MSPYAKLGPLGWWRYPIYWLLTGITALFVLFDILARRWR